MKGMTMNLNARLPVANCVAPHSSAVRALPRCTSVSSARQSTFFGGAVHQFTSLRSRCPSQQRSSAFIVEAAKKSVGDLSKGDLEGKVVLVRAILDKNLKYRILALKILYGTVDMTVLEHVRHVPIL